MRSAQVNKRKKVTRLESCVRLQSFATADCLEVLRTGFCAFNSRKGRRFAFPTSRHQILDTNLSKLLSEEEGRNRHNLKPNYFHASCWNTMPRGALYRYRLQVFFNCTVERTNVCWRSGDICVIFCWTNIRHVQIVTFKTSLSISKVIQTNLNLLQILKNL